MRGDLRCRAFGRFQRTVHAIVAVLGRFSLLAKCRRIQQRVHAAGGARGDPACLHQRRPVRRLGSGFGGLLRFLLGRDDLRLFGAARHDLFGLGFIEPKLFHQRPGANLFDVAHVD